MEHESKETITHRKAKRYDVDFAESINGNKRRLVCGSGTSRIQELGSCQYPLLSLIYNAIIYSAYSLDLSNIESGYKPQKLQTISL